MTSDLTVTRDQVRELDRIAIEEYGIPGLILMENAGRHCACAAAAMLGGSPGAVAGARATVLCGSGNNGGDGFVVARHLSNWGASVDVVLLASAGSVLDRGGESATNLRVVTALGIPVQEATSGEEARKAIADRREADLFVDALLGTGARGDVKEPFRSAIEALNGLGRAVLAVDLPSGLDCDTGRPLGVAVRARRTVTFVARKAGFMKPGADAYTGEVEVVEIGVPRSAVDRVLRGL